MHVPTASLSSPTVGQVQTNTDLQCIWPERPWPFEWAMDSLCRGSLFSCSQSETARIWGRGEWCVCGLAYGCLCVCVYSMCIVTVGSVCAQCKGVCVCITCINTHFTWTLLLYLNSLLCRLVVHLFFCVTLLINLVYDEVKFCSLNIGYCPQIIEDKNHVTYIYIFFSNPLSSNLYWN